MKHVLVTGASGLVGRGAIKHFASLGNCKVTGVSRRLGAQISGASQSTLDLLDAKACAAFIRSNPDITHLVYAALNEKEGALFEGWHDPNQMEINASMLRNVLEPLARAGGTLRHVVLMQGTKAYGAHVGETPIPARERSPRSPHANFYFLQEDYLRERQRGASWYWTVLRPQLVIGEAVGANLNLLLAIGVYAALLRAQGEALHFPGRNPMISEMVDVDLLARAITWSGEEPVCRNEIFNLSNGDVVTLRGIWPVIADTMGMEVGPERPTSVAAYVHQREREWAEIVRRHRLVAPTGLAQMLGESCNVADFYSGYASDVSTCTIVSSIKARQAGFHECADTDLIIRRWLLRYQELRLLPSSDGGFANSE